MLKYERISKDNKIAVTYKDRTTLFTKDFVTALTLAIFMHVSFLFLFNIKDIGLLLHFHPSNWVFNVESDLVANQITLEAETAGYRDELIREPHYDDFFLVNMPLFVIEKNFDDSLLHLENKILDYEEPFTVLKPKKKIEIFLCHEMESKKIINSDSLAKFEKIDGKGYAKFKVHVEDQSGKIIWSELKDLLGIKSQQAKELLAALEFEAVENSFATVGEVEIFFND